MTLRQLVDVITNAAAQIEETDRAKKGHVGARGVDKKSVFKTIVHTSTVELNVNVSNQEEGMSKSGSRQRLTRAERREAEKQWQTYGMQQWLQQRAFGLVPHVEMSKERRAALRECFDILDADGGGSISNEELSLAMKARASRISQRAIPLREQRLAPGALAARTHGTGSACPTSHLRRSAGDGPRARRDQGGAREGRLRWRRRA
jgi:hypothetical protein